MVTIDAEQLKQTSPAERITLIQTLRNTVAERLRSWQEQTDKDLQTLATLEQDTRRELETITRIEVPQSREVNINKLFKKKSLEETVTPATIPETRPPQPNILQTLQHAYDFAHKDAYDKIASIRDKVATGETLTPAEERSAQYYGELLQSFHKITPYIHDAHTKETLTRSEKAIQQLRQYQHEDEPTKRQEF